MPDLDILLILAFLFGGYLCGCFNTAFLLAKIKKVNIMESGSKNPGASNAMVTMGWKAGVAAEVLTLPRLSIGKNIYESKLYLETTDLFAWTLVVVLISLIVEKAAVAAIGKAAKRRKNG